MFDGPLPHQALLAAIVSSSHDAIASKTLGGIVTSWNDAAERLFGYSAAEIVGRHISILAAPGRDAEMSSILERIARGERVEHFDTVRRRKDGALVEISLTVSPVTDSNGKIVGASKIARDISDRKAAEEHQRLLVAELDHRVRNTLAVVSAIATYTLRPGIEPVLGRDKFLARLQALSETHGLLSQESWRPVQLRSIVAAHTAPYGERIAASGDQAALSPKQALILGMALHELGTNAVKYGALAVPDGSVELTWRVLGSPVRQLELTWRERGGPPIATAAHPGFGRTMIERSFGGEGESARFDFARSGLTCELRMALEAA